MYVYCARCCEHSDINKRGAGRHGDESVAWEVDTNYLNNFMIKCKIRTVINIGK